MIDIKFDRAQGDKLIAEAHRLRSEFIWNMLTKAFRPIFRRRNNHVVGAAA